MVFSRIEWSKQTVCPKKRAGLQNITDYRKDQERNTQSWEFYPDCQKYGKVKTKFFRKVIKIWK